MSKSEIPKQSMYNSTVDTNKLRDSSQIGSLINPQVIEQWIGDIMKESGEGNTLERFGVDRKSLKASGLLSEEVNRLFRCLFVYSFGFYERVQEIVKKPQTAVQVWKVFGILLEYASRGEFEFIVNSIQEEHNQQNEFFQRQLTQQQKQLQELEERNQDRELKADSEIQSIKKQNEWLLSQREALENDFKSVSTAFEEEVSLRVKFEFKINEIYSIHRLLQLKHSAMLDDLVLTKQENQSLNSSYLEVKKLFESSKGQNLEAQQKIKDLESHIKVLEDNIANREQTINDLQTKIQQLSRSENRDYQLQKTQEHQLDQLLLQNQELKAQNATHIHNLEQVNIQIADAEEVNKQLRQTNQSLKQDLLISNTSLLTTNTKLNHIIKIEQGLRQQYTKLQEDNRLLENECSFLRQNHKKLEVDLQFSTQKVETYAHEIMLMNQNVQQMKGLKLIQDEELIRQKVKLDQNDETIHTKEETITDLDKTLTYQQQRLHTVTIELSELEQKYRLQGQEMKINEDAFKNKIRFLEECLNTERQQISEERDRVERILIQFEQQKTLLTDLRQQHKQQVFDNNALVTKNLFFSRLIDNEKQRNEDLITEITELKLLLETRNREFNNLELKYQTTLEQHQLNMDFQKNRHNAVIRDFKALIKEMNYKMIQEDLLAQLIRLQDKFNDVQTLSFKLKGNISILQSEKQGLQDINESYYQEIITLKDQTKHYSDKYFELDNKYQLQQAQLQEYQQSEMNLKLELEQNQQSLETVNSNITKLQQELQNQQQEVARQKSILKRTRQNALNDDTQRRQGSKLELDMNEALTQQPSRRNTIRKQIPKLINLNQKQNDSNNQFSNTAQSGYNTIINQSNVQTVPLTKQNLKGQQITQQLDNQVQGKTIEQTENIDQFTVEINNISYVDQSNLQQSQVNPAKNKSAAIAEIPKRTIQIQIDDKPPRRASLQEHIHEQVRTRSVSQRSERETIVANYGKKQFNRREFTRLYQMASAHYQL